MAQIRAKTMSAQTLRERAALFNTPTGRAESHFMLVMSEAALDWAQCNVIGEQPAAKVRWVEQIYAGFKVSSNGAGKHAINYMMHYVAGALSDAELALLDSYMQSEPGKRAMTQLAAGQKAF